MQVVLFLQGIILEGSHTRSKESLALLFLREFLLLHVSPVKGNIMKIENEIRKTSALHDVSPKVCTICS